MHLLQKDAELYDQHSDKRVGREASLCWGCRQDCESCCNVAKELDPTGLDVLTLTDCVLSPSVATIITSAFQEPIPLLKISYSSIDPTFSSLVRCKNLQLTSENRFALLDKIHAGLRSLDLSYYPFDRSHHPPFTPHLLDSARMLRFSDLKHLALCGVDFSDWGALSSTLTQLKSLKLRNSRGAQLQSLALALPRCANLREFSVSDVGPLGHSCGAFWNALAQATQLHALTIAAPLDQTDRHSIEEAVLSQLRLNSSLHFLSYRIEHPLHSSVFDAVASSPSLGDLHLSFDSPSDPSAITRIFQSATLQSISLSSRIGLPVAEKTNLYAAVIQHPASVDVNILNLDQTFLANIRRLKEHNMRIRCVTLQCILLHSSLSLEGDPLEFRRLAPAEST